MHKFILDIFYHLFLTIAKKLNFEHTHNNLSQLKHPFREKSMIHSNVFWLTHWSIRLGLHSVITEMNSNLQAYLGQLQREVQEADK